MQENEPRLPSYEELRKIHEEAPAPQPPNHTPNRLNYEELRSAQPATAREAEEFRTHPEQVNRIDATEAEIAAYQKNLDARVEAKQITPRERTYLLTRYDQFLASTLNSPEACAIRDVPEPKNDNTRQQQAEGNEGPEQQQSVKRPDWKLMINDPTYRREVEKKLRDERASTLHQMQKEQDSEPQRSNSGGRNE